MEIKYDIGIVSGYFDCLHAGHIEYIQGAKERCYWLIVIVNNDFQVELKKSKKFMDENHRKKILENIIGVNEVIISIDNDPYVCKSIELISNKYVDNTKAFFNSGDRVKGNLSSTEEELCKKLSIDFVLLGQPKIYSSSELLK